MPPGPTCHLGLWLFGSLKDHDALRTRVLSKHSLKFTLIIALALAESTRRAHKTRKLCRYILKITMAIQLYTREIASTTRVDQTRTSNTQDL
jgi:hypothetical protein